MFNRALASGLLRRRPSRHLGMDRVGVDSVGKPADVQSGDVQRADGAAVSSVASACPDGSGRTRCAGTCGTARQTRFSVDPC